MVTWIVVLVVVIGLVVLVSAALPLVGRLSGLRRAALRLQQRQEQAMQLQRGAAVLEQSLAALRQRAERAGDQIAVIKAAHGGRDDRHTFLDR